MASTSSIDGPSLYSSALPSRLIPGTFSTGNLRQKLPSIASQEAATRWTFTKPAPAASLWSWLARYLLPQPVQRNRCPRLGFRVVTDVLLIAMGFGLVTFLVDLGWMAVAFQSEFPAAPRLVSEKSSLGPLLLYGTIFALLGYAKGLYYRETVERPAQERLVLTRVMFWSTVWVGAAWAASSFQTIPAVSLSLAAPVNFLLLLAWRNRGRGKWTGVAIEKRNVLIIGAGMVGRKLAANLGSMSTTNYVVRGFLDENETARGEILGRVADLSCIARREFVDEIIVTLPAHSEIAQKAIWEARRNRINIKLVPDLFGFDSAALALEKFGDIPVLTLSEEPIPAFGLFVKRVIDVVLSIIGLVLASPLLAGIAVAIRMDSPGPVLYRAPRLGLKGRRFLCSKFRTMVANADELKDQMRCFNERSGAMFKIRNDPRVTRVGRILRRYSLDELPQLWNILRGEMSLVGPRPHPVDDFERYTLEDMQRLEVTPGLTGLWQITARRDPSFTRSMTLDRQYIGGWSLGMDFRILCKTLGVVLKGEGT